MRAREENTKKDNEKGNWGTKGRSSEIRRGKEEQGTERSRMISKAVAASKSWPRPIHHQSSKPRTHPSRPLTPPGTARLGENQQKPLRKKSQNMLVVPWESTQKQPREYVAKQELLVFSLCKYGEQQHSKGDTGTYAYQTLLIRSKSSTMHCASLQPHHFSFPLATASPTAPISPLLPPAPLLTPPPHPAIIM